MSFVRSLIVAAMLASLCLITGCADDSAPETIPTAKTSGAAEETTAVVSIALFGDSTFETYYLDARQNPALEAHHDLAPDFDGRLHVRLTEMLEDRGVEATVYNFGVSGMDSTEALSGSFASPSIWEECLAVEPDIVVIRFGPNDLAASVPTETFRSSLERMVEEARSSGATPVLATDNYVDYPDHCSWDWNGPTGLGPYSEQVIALSQAEDLTLVDVRGRFAAEIAAGNWDLFGHNDSEYLDIWEDGSSFGTPDHYTNIHQWIGGTDIIAQEITEALLSFEPLCGGDVDALGRNDAWMP